MSKTVISEYFSEDNNKKAVVSIFEGRYVIDFYVNEEYNHSILNAYQDKSLHFVEDAAENYVLGHFKNYRDFK